MWILKRALQAVILNTTFGHFQIWKVLSVPKRRYTLSLAHSSKIQWNKVHHTLDECVRP